MIVSILRECDNNYMTQSYILVVPNIGISRIIHWYFVMKVERPIKYIFSRKMHSMAMVMEQKSAKRYSLRVFRHVIDFLMYNTGLTTKDIFRDREQLVEPS